MIAAEQAPMLAEAAKRRQEAGGEKGRQHRGKVAGPENGASQNRSGRVDRQLADAAKVTHTSINKASKIKKADPKLADDVRKGKVKLNAAYNKVTGKSPKPSAACWTGKRPRASWQSCWA